MVRARHHSDARVRLSTPALRRSPLRIRHCAAVIAAIKDMTVRGAPAIGAAGAFGLALAARASTASTV
jgi:methylthioribose-1-phosphate isomerase